ncbi:VanZ family protein [Chryseolinea sp. T2]|uniref:VanZ family protein n=1 Tax=Chryseolinea sp. T2 TaxID=3129255 RepID=UPI003078A060
MSIRIKSFWPGIVMLIVATVLFCIPGNQLPDEDWLGEISADKIVHVGLFAALVALWGLPFVYRSASGEIRTLKRALLLIVVIAILYGIAIEFIQGAYIPNRTYSLADMVADTLGSLIGGVFVNRQVPKKANHI